jgi:hypothetical protein
MWFDVISYALWGVLGDISWLLIVSQFFFCGESLVNLWGRITDRPTSNQQHAGLIVQRRTCMVISSISFTCPMIDQKPLRSNTRPSIVLLLFRKILKHFYFLFPIRSTQTVGGGMASLQSNFADCFCFVSLVFGLLLAGSTTHHCHNQYLCNGPVNWLYL